MHWLNKELFPRDHHHLPIFLSLLALLLALPFGIILAQNEQIANSNADQTQCVPLPQCYYNGTCNPLKNLQQDGNSQNGQGFMHRTIPWCLPTNVSSTPNCQYKTICDPSNPLMCHPQMMCPTPPDQLSPMPTPGCYTIVPTCRPQPSGLPRAQCDPIPTVVCPSISPGQNLSPTPWPSIPPQQGYGPTPTPANITCVPCGSGCVIAPAPGYCRDIAQSPVQCSVITSSSGQPTCKATPLE